MSAQPIYYQIAAPSRHAPELPIAVQQDSEIGLRVTVRQGGAGVSDIELGLLCYAVGEIVGAANAGTFVPFDILTIDHANDVTYQATYLMGPEPDPVPEHLGTLRYMPAGTVAVVAICYIDAGEPMFLEFGAEPVSPTLGPRVTAVTQQSGNTLRRINQIAYIDENGFASVLTIEQVSEGLAIRINSVKATTGSNAARIEQVNTTQTDAVSAVGVRVDTVEATTSANLAAINTETVARTDADSALAAQITTVSSTAGQNTASVNDVAATQATLTGIVEAIRSIEVDANGNIADLVLRALDGTESRTDARLRADFITLISGAAFFGLQSDRAILNVPLDVTRAGDVASIGSPNAAFWLGDPTIPIASRTPSNSALSVINGQARIDGLPYVPGGGGVYVASPQVGSGTANLQATTDSFTTKGGIMRGTAKFTARSFRSYTSTSSVVSNTFNVGTAQIKVYRDNGGGFVQQGSTVTASGLLERFVQDDTAENGVYRISERLTFEDYGDGSTQNTAGDTISWRAIVDSISGILAGHTLATRLEFSVSDP